MNTLRTWLILYPCRKQDEVNEERVKVKTERSCVLGPSTASSDTSTHLLALHVLSRCGDCILAAVCIFKTSAVGELSNVTAVINCLSRLIVAMESAIWDITPTSLRIAMYSLKQIARQAQSFFLKSWFTSSRTLDDWVRRGYRRDEGSMQNAYKIPVSVTVVSAWQTCPSSAKHSHQGICGMFSAFSSNYPQNMNVSSVCHGLFLGISSSCSRKPEKRIRCIHASRLKSEIFYSSNSTPCKSFTVSKCVCKCLLDWQQQFVAFHQNWPPDKFYFCGHKMWFSTGWNTLWQIQGVLTTPPLSSTITLWDHSVQKQENGVWGCNWSQSVIGWNFNSEGLTKILDQRLTRQHKYFMKGVLPFAHGTCQKLLLLRWGTNLLPTALKQNLQCKIRRRYGVAWNIHDCSSNNVMRNYDEKDATWHRPGIRHVRRRNRHFIIQHGPFLPTQGFVAIFLSFVLSSVSWQLP